MTCPLNNDVMSEDRIMSSIPKTDADSNWIYPSPKMFYDAMKKKGYSPNESDMEVIVNIHNMVNEQSWTKILQWEALHQKKCSMPRLERFVGRPDTLSPKAWFLCNILGYKRPFDRHDWYIDRCGVKVRYILDFYGGEENNSVYLDVRPAIDSVQKANECFSWSVLIGAEGYKRSSPTESISMEETTIRKCRICHIDDSRVASPVYTPNTFAKMSKCQSSNFINQFLAYFKFFDRNKVFTQNDANEFLTPCQCKGSMKYVHRGCLDAWRMSSARNDSFYRCEQCMSEYCYEPNLKSSILSNHIFVNFLCVAVFLAFLGGSYLSVEIISTHMNDFAEIRYHYPMELRTSTDETGRIFYTDGAIIHDVFIPYRPTPTMSANQPTTFTSQNVYSNSITAKEPIDEKVSKLIWTGLLLSCTNVLINTEAPIFLFIGLSLLMIGMIRILFHATLLDHIYVAVLSIFSIPMLWLRIKELVKLKILKIIRINYSKVVDYKID